jgi:hypothetical protein
MYTSIEHEEVKRRRDEGERAVGFEYNSEGNQQITRRGEEAKRRRWEGCWF